MSPTERLTHVAELYMNRHQTTNDWCDQQIGVKLQEMVEVCRLLHSDIEQVRQMAETFIRDTGIPYNGYQSFVACFQSALDCIIGDSLNTEASLSCQKTDKNNTTRKRLLQDLGRYKNWLISYGKLLAHVKDTNTLCDRDSLFPKPDNIGLANVIWENCAEIEQRDFTGRLAGIHCNSYMKQVLAKTSMFYYVYSGYFFATGGIFSRIVNVLWTCWKHKFSPEYYEFVTRESVRYGGVDYLKASWSVNDSIFNSVLIRMTQPSMAVNITVGLKPRPLVFESQTDDVDSVVYPPSRCIDGIAVSCRLISKKRRSGMLGSRWFPGVDHQVSPYLIFHCHGGGYISQSTRTFEPFLRNWGQQLDAPIFSVDYSLAPEAPFPQACEEVFYAYCWALKHCHALGSTAERVILVGDSAGGNLVTTVVMEAIRQRVRKPDGLFLIYPLLYVGMFSTPSRLMSALDPFLTMRVMYGLLKSYAGAEESSKPDDTLEPTETSKYPKSGPCYIINPPSQYASYTLANVPLLYLVENTQCESVNNLCLKSDQRLNPNLASDHLMSQFPSTCIVSGQFDPLIDDSVMMARRLRKLGVPVDLHVFENIGHNFLGVADADPSSMTASVQVDRLLKLVMLGLC